MELVAGTENGPRVERKVDLQVTSSTRSLNESFRVDAFIALRAGLLVDTLQSGVQGGQRRRKLWEAGWAVALDAEVHRCSRPRLRRQCMHGDGQRQRRRALLPLPLRAGLLLVRRLQLL